MAESIEIIAEPRDVVGKSAHRLAPEGKLPAILYGAAHKPQAISIDRHDFHKLLVAHGGGSTLVHVIVGDAKPVNAIIKEIAHDPVKGTVLHVDFWAIQMNQQVATTVPLRLVGDAVGVKTGGVLTHNFTDLHIEAMPGDIPEAIEVDVSALEVGDSLSIADIVPPKGVVITMPAEDIVCSVIVPTVAPTEEESAQVTEPEVVGEKKEEE